jgi:trimeric autotransporter adhesin
MRTMLFLHKRFLLLTIGIGVIVQLYGQSAWLITGNELSSTGKLGSTNNFDVSFITNNLPRVAIKTNGLIGIGTTTPAFNLDVLGTGRFTSTLKIGAYTLPAVDGAAGQLLKTDGAGNLSWSNDDNTTYTAGTGISLAGNAITNTAPDQLVTLSQGSGISISGTYPNFSIGSTHVSSQWTTAGSHIHYNAGNVGIGTSTPAFRLDVSGTGRYTGALKIGAYTLPDTDGLGNQVLKTDGAGNVSWSADDNTAYSAGTGISITGSTIANTAPDQVVSLNAGSGITISGTYPSFTIAATGGGGSSQWTTSGSNIYYNAGNVGIGTSSPAFKLDVAGDLNLSTGSVWRLGGSTVFRQETAKNNLFIGEGAGSSNTTGNHNIVTGIRAFTNNTTGLYNTAYGYQALFSNTDGHSNTAIGLNTLYANTSGSGNTATGYTAMYSNTSGIHNTAYGHQAMFSNTTGNTNTASGYQSLYSNTTGYYNTALGYQALYSNMDGTYNTASGHQALYSNTSGVYNTAVGYYALRSNTTGGQNTAIGLQALYGNSTGSHNTAVGNEALSSNGSGSDNTATGFVALNRNTTGNYNTANGVYALHKNTTGSNNTAIGHSTLYHNSTGENNTAIGMNALLLNTEGNQNVAIGNESLYSNTTGSYNTSIGLRAMLNNTTGVNNTATGQGALSGNTTGKDNTAIGVGSLAQNTSGSYNAAIGSEALLANKTGTENTAGGYYALRQNTIGKENTANGYYAMGRNISGSYNTASGSNALFLNETGNLNTAIGTGAGTQGIDFSNSTALGAYARTSASNQVRIGDNSVTSIGGYADWTNISDGRVKRNMKQNVPGLAFINKLKPITYNLNLEAADRLIQSSAAKDKEGKISESSGDVTARNAKEKVVHTGFVAQEVEKAAKELNFDFSGVDAAKNEHDLYGLRYSQFVVPLVKAVQELSQKNDEKDAKIHDLQKQIDELKKMILELKNATTSTTSNNSAVADVNTARLEQNIPNPFSRSTLIRYFVPLNAFSAQLVVTDMKGSIINAITLNKGQGQVNLNTATLAAGTYTYSLWIEGKKTDAKQMILTR